MIRPQPKPTPRVKAQRKPLSRSSLKRGGPIQRKARLTAKRWGIKYKRPRRLDTAQSNPAFLAWVRTEPCCVPNCAQGPIEAHHAGKNPGLGMKAPDDTAVPLCRSHHRQLTDHAGVFKGTSREALRAMQDDWIGATFSRWLAAGSRRSR